MEQAKDKMTGNDSNSSDQAADATTTQHLPRDGVNILRTQGFLFLPRWATDQQLLGIARSIGHVVKLPAFLHHSGIHTVHRLHPSPSEVAPGGRYSSEFGLAPFPLHTDLAHWTRPPRYTLIRCISGSTSVFTKLLHYTHATHALGDEVVERALFKPRRPPRGEVLSLLPMKLRSDSEEGIRWDTIFLKPMNAAAHRVADSMNRGSWQKDCIQSVPLVHFGDTLLIDNWRCLHGRSRVPATSMHRQLERVYLSEICI